MLMKIQQLGIPINYLFLISGWCSLHDCWWNLRSFWGCYLGLAPTDHKLDASCHWSSPSQQRIWWVLVVRTIVASQRLLNPSSHVLLLNGNYSLYRTGMLTVLLVAVLVALDNMYCPCLPWYNLCVTNWDWLFLKQKTVNEGSLERWGLGKIWTGKWDL